MHYVKQLSNKDFLQKYWQKQILVIKNSIAVEDFLISGEELAGLACEKAIESRIVFANDTQSQWTCAYGPFTSQQFSQLEEKNWTLLVQSVDDYLPEAKELRDTFNLLPKWRMDDVMLSYATPGGGVGPHFDYYDVFLIQLSGSREWKIGQSCNSATPLRAHDDLKLLQDFQLAETHILNPGDLLYIPAGLAHWGTAISENCITASVGFRAPAYSELLHAGSAALADQFKDDQRYKDIHSDDEVDKYLIGESVEQQMLELWKYLDQKKFVNILTNEFSKQVTEIRNEDALEYSDHRIEDLENASLQQHPASRFAYRKTPTGAILYVNGQAYPTSVSTAIAICHSEFSDIEANDQNLLLELVNNGSLLLNPV